VVAAEEVAQRVDREPMARQLVLEPPVYHLITAIYIHIYIDI